MKIGVKVFYESDIPYIRKIADSLDFVETMAVIGRKYHRFSDLGLPFVVHNMHGRWGVNFADPDKVRKNTASLNHSIAVADELGAKKIIVHPGRFSHDLCSEEQVVDFLSDFKDKRILIENMPYSSEGTIHIGYSFEGMRYLLKNTKRRMLLDFAHGSESAAWRGERPLPFIKRLMTLRPAHFHMSDTRLKTIRDMHLHLREGTLPLKEYRNLLPKNAWITLEVDHNPWKTEHDIEFLKS
ncbi:TPA: TIM barrel protein [Candidatus Woesearchaeota archaeon]|nr:TIM barrel protein [Candidatus Woesearchaeota archaeon]